MTALVLAALLAAQPEARCGDCRPLARATMHAATATGVDPLLLGAVALVESGGRDVVQRRPWGRVVGPWQLAVRSDCAGPGQTPCDLVRPLSVGAVAAAAILSRGLRRYNASARWRRAVMRVWRRMERQGPLAGPRARPPKRCGVTASEYTRCLTV